MTKKIRCIKCDDDLSEETGTMTDYKTFKQVGGRKMLYLCGGCEDE